MSETPPPPVHPPHTTATIGYAPNPPTPSPLGWALLFLAGFFVGPISLLLCSGAMFYCTDATAGTVLSLALLAVSLLGLSLAILKFPLLRPAAIGALISVSCLALLLGGCFAMLFASSRV